MKKTKKVKKGEKKGWFSQLKSRFIYNTTNRTDRIFVRILIYFVAGFLLTYYLQLRLFKNDNGQAIDFVVNHFLVYCWNSMLMFFMIMFVSAFFRQAFTGVGITWMLLIILSYINSRKMEFRGQPVMPEDFMLADQAGTLTKFVDTKSIIMTVVACVLALVLANVFNHLIGNRLDIEPRGEKWYQKNNRGLRFSLIVIAIIGFVGGTYFVRHHSGERKQQIPWLNTQLEAWNQVINYERNGFILGFMYNWSKFDLEEPEDYSEDKIAELKKEYKKAKKQAEVKTNDDGTKTDLKKSLEDTDYNIIVVLNESFYDFEKVSSLYDIKRNPEHATDESGDVASDDILPNWHKLRNSTPSGYMYTLDYGGGTANIEYEVYTGLTDYWANTVPYVDLIPRTKNMVSIADYAHSNGYDTLSIHPFNGGMYKRNISLPKIGFNQFIDENTMDFTDKDSNRQYINDAAAYKQVMKELKSHKNKTMIGLVTMQNHSGYGEDNFKYRNYLLNNARDLDERISIETYLQSVHLADKYLGRFIDELSKFDEKTVVLFYGDHAPGIVSRANDSDNKDTRDLARMTPYFIWANFDLPNKAKNLPMTTPNCLTNTLYNTLNVKKPDYYYLVDEVCKETPILTQAYYGDGAPEDTETLHKYNLLNYDILGGKQYWLQ